MKAQTGFILIMTLLTMMVMTLLVLNTMQHLLLYQKAFNRYDGGNRSLYQMEHIALDLAHTPLEQLKPECVRNEDRMLQTMHCSSHCTLKTGLYQFNYVIEDLGDMPCVVVANGASYSSTHHRRVSVQLTNTDDSGALLQIRYITAVKQRPCHATLQFVREGITSWRFIP